MKPTIPTQSGPRCSTCGAATLYLPLEDRDAFVCRCGARRWARAEDKAQIDAAKAQIDAADRAEQEIDRITALATELVDTKLMMPEQIVRWLESIDIGEDN